MTWTDVNSLTTVTCSASRGRAAPRGAERAGPVYLAGSGDALQQWQTGSPRDGQRMSTECARPGKSAPGTDEAVTLSHLLLSGEAKQPHGGAVRVAHRHCAQRIGVAGGVWVTAPAHPGQTASGRLPLPRTRRARGGGVEMMESRQSDAVNETAGLLGIGKVSSHDAIQHARSRRLRSSDESPDSWMNC